MYVFFTNIFPRISEKRVIPLDPRAWTRCAYTVRKVSEDVLPWTQIKCRVDLYSRSVLTAQTRWAPKQRATLRLRDIPVLAMSHQQHHHLVRGCWYNRVVYILAHFRRFSCNLQKQKWITKDPPRSNLFLSKIRRYFGVSWPAEGYATSTMNPLQPVHHRGVGVGSVLTVMIRKDGTTRQTPNELEPAVSGVLSWPPPPPRLKTPPLALTKTESIYYKYIAGN